MLQNGEEFFPPYRRFAARMMRKRAVVSADDSLRKGIERWIRASIAIGGEPINCE
jgi:hypothetical protein